MRLSLGRSTTDADIDRAAEAFPQAETIYEANIATLEKLGHDGWRALGVDRPSVTPVAQDTKN